MGKKYLSKSTFIKGVQCQKALYLHKYHWKLSDEEKQILKSICEQIDIPVVFYEKILSYL